MITHFDQDTGILTATCSNEELHCIYDANLPIDTERAKTGRDLLARLDRLKKERENLHDTVEVHVGLANVKDHSPTGATTRSSGQRGCRGARPRWRLRHRR